MAGGVELVLGRPIGGGAGVENEASEGQESVLVH